MPDLADWPDAPTLEGNGVRLEPLRVEHAEELAPLLDDAELHKFTGGEPAGLEDLRGQYRHRVGGWSAARSQRWLNWVVRRCDDGRAVGTVQATVTAEAGQLIAEVAWVIGTAHQGRGYARAAARMMVAWLYQRGISTVIAHVHPRHEASAAVARALHLTPTAVVKDGEVRWRS